MVILWQPLFQLKRSPLWHLCRQWTLAFTAVITMQFVKRCNALGYCTAREIEMICMLVQLYLCHEFCSFISKPFAATWVTCKWYRICIQVFPPHFMLCGWGVRVEYCLLRVIWAFCERTVGWDTRLRVKKVAPFRQIKLPGSMTMQYYDMMRVCGARLNTKHQPFGLPSSNRRNAHRWHNYRQCSEATAFALAVWNDYSLHESAWVSLALPRGSQHMKSSLKFKNHHEVIYCV